MPRNSLLYKTMTIAKEPNQQGTSIAGKGNKMDYNKSITGY